MAKILKKLTHWSCLGVLPVEEMQEVLLQVIAAIGMHPAPGCEPALWWYPAQGKGGQGYTLIQPLTESFISADAYEKTIDGEPVNQTEIILASCRDCDPAVVGRLLSRLVGPLVGEG